MKKNPGIAVRNFFGLSVLIVLFDLLVAIFSFADLSKIIIRPGHIAFICVLGLILAAGAFVRPTRSAQDA